MSGRLYMDVHVPRAITEGLRLRGVDVVTAQEDGARTLEDSDLLDRPVGLGRLLFTQDADLLAEAKRRQEAQHAFLGIVCAHQLQVTVGQCVRDLALIATAGEPEDFANRVEFLPLK